MKSTFLAKILETKSRRVAVAKLAAPAIDVLARTVRNESVPHSLRSAIKRGDRVNVIAEIKRASPSKGVINGRVDAAETARKYQAGGASAISVLTEEDYFRGSLSDLVAARGATSLPVLRKDFVIDEFQVFEAAAAGADAVLLIVAAMSPDRLRQLHRLAEVELGLDALVEVHDRDELEIAAEIGCELIGVNNRNLHTFDVSLDVSRRLIEYKPRGALMIAESGISTQADVRELHSLGFDAFLVGEALMTNRDPRAILEEWL